MPYIPAPLKEHALITIFTPQEARLGCIIRSYASTEGLEIGDCGNYFFYYNASENDWRVYADCY